MNDDRLTEDQRQQARMQQLKSCQTLTTIALIGAPVSLLIGGVALSTAALVCAIVAFVRMRKISSSSDVPGSLERTLYNQSIIALVISSVAMALNLVAFVLMFGAIMSFLQTGDTAGLMDAMTGATQEDASSGTSIWDL